MSKAGKPATALLSGLLLCEECGSRFIASDQHGYQCATRTYGGVSPCSNRVRMKRDRAEAAIVLYIAKVLLSPELVRFRNTLIELATPTVTLLMAGSIGSSNSRGHNYGLCRTTTRQSPLQRRPALDGKAGRVPRST